MMTKRRHSPGMPDRDNWRLSVDLFSFDYDGVVFGPYNISLPFAYDSDTMRMTYDTRQSIIDAVIALELPNES